MARVIRLKNCGRLLAALLIVLSGCSRGPELARVHGKVSVDGQPLPRGKVLFAPIASGEDYQAGRPALGIIQPDGSYRLTTLKKHDGAQVGAHRVTIMGKPSREDEEDQAVDQKTKEPVAASSGIPEFQLLRLLGQQFEVVSGQDNQIDLKLTSDQIRRFARRGD